MEKLTPIPTAWSVYWRALRLYGVPFVVFAGVVAVLIVQWKELDGGGVPGIAEGLRVNVTCPRPALLEALKVRPYEWVEAGEVVATLRGADPLAELDFLQSELQLARLRLEPSLPDQNAMDFERLRVDNLRLKQELAVAEVELQRAESALRRNSALFKEGLVSEDTYDLCLRDRDRYQAEASEKRKAIVQVEGRLVALRPLGEPGLGDTNQRLQALVHHLNGKMLAAETNWQVVTLVAPISGMVHAVTRQPGEYVGDGEVVMTINSPKADRIVGYLRQPYAVEPEPGMKVEILTRARQRQKFMAEVSEIGAQVEVITNALAVLRPFAAVDVGLPVVVRVPPDVSIRPGETFDLHFMSEPPRRKNESSQRVASETVLSLTP